MRNVLGMVGLVLVASLVAACNVGPDDVESDDVMSDGVESDGDIGEAASALPGEEREIEYYSDATMEHMVGFRFISCGGSSLWGQTSQYWIATRGDSCSPPYMHTSPFVECTDWTGWCPAEFQYCIQCC